MALASSKSLMAVPVRPLNQGMRLDLPPNAMPSGSFLRLQNYRVPTAGIERRDGFITFDANNGPDYYNEQVQKVIHFYQLDADAETLILTDKSLFKRTGTNASERMEMTAEIELTANTSSSANDIVDVSVNLELEDFENITSGDLLILDDVEYEVLSKSTYNESSSPNTTIKIEASGIVADELVTATSQTIRYLFHRDLNMCPTYCTVPRESDQSEDRMFIADQSDRGIYQYTTAGGLEVAEINSAVSTADDDDPVYDNLISARTITYFADRMWMANTVEEDGEHKQRIRWSQVGDFDRVCYDYYVDLPYTEGECRALMPLGSLLVAYFEDAVYYGRTSNVTNLPLTWTRIETGNVGLVATSALAAYTDLHFFVGQDDVYLFSEALAIKAMDCPVITESLEYTQALDTELVKYIQVEHDQSQDTMVFFFPDRIDSAIPLDAVSERLWRYNYKTNAWSYDEVRFADTDKTVASYLFSGICPSKVYIYGRSWQDWLALDDPTYDPSTDTDSDNARWVRGDNTTIPDEDTFDDYNSWYDLQDLIRKDKTLKVQVWHAPEEKAYLLEEETDTTVDTIGDYTYPIWALFETPDTDMNLPDVNKTWTRISLKSYQNRTDRLSGTNAPLSFEIYVSSSQGWKWKRPYTMNWPHEINAAGEKVRAYNEGKIDMRATGSTLRYKCISSEEVPKWKLSEYVLLVTGRGLQVDI